ncbi:MAG: GNAT family N-acetyltransferase [Chloroflexi bacterium]|nr:GNAT family N-acetyltransferase [Chloroflexota bacterium]
MSKAARPKDKVTIREMGPEDLEGILEIERATKGEKRAATYAPVPDSCIGGEIGTSVVAEARDKVVGFVLGRVVGSPSELRDVAWIELIGIHPDYQRQGIGRKMLDVWKERCRKKGIKKVHIMLNWRDWRMLSFFESMGFSRGDLTDFQAEL